MAPHPVQLRVTPPARLARIHVLIRLVLLAALGTLGWSSVYWLLYLALPAVAALLVAQKGSERYLAEDGARLVRALRWLAGAYGYLWLLTDELPGSEAPAAVELAVAPGGAPTAGSALLRLVYSLPAVLLLGVLSFAAGILWIVAAVWILVVERAPAGLADFFATVLGYQLRLAAYHLSLVDRYPSLRDAAAFSGSSYTPRSDRLQEPA